MSALEAVVAAVVRYLPGNLRQALGSELAKAVPPLLGSAPKAEPAGEPSSPPPWDHIWRTLINASASAERITDLLGPDRAFFDFEPLTRDAHRLKRKIDDAYSLMCVAPRFEGLDLEEGDHLDQVRHQVDLQRAKILDSALPTPPPADPVVSGPAWTVHYRPHGGFTATATGLGAGGEPIKAWGMATTARMAEHVLRSYTPDRPPATVTFTPPLPERFLPMAGMDIDQADLSELGPQISDVLHQRGAIYDEHIAAAEAAKNALLNHGDPDKYLAEQAAVLNATDPQIPRDDMLCALDNGLVRDYRGFVRTVQWVPTSLVVGTLHRVWGEFNGHRDWAPRRIAEGLAGSDLHQFTDRYFGDPIRLERVVGWAGPLYRVSINGNHRIHTSRMLGLPWILAKLEFSPPPLAWDMVGLITSDYDRSEPRAPMEQRAAVRAAIIRGLIGKRVIDGEIHGEGLDAKFSWTRLPAPWLLRPPEHAAAISAIYESRYPGALARVGIPTESVASAEAWVEWATS